MLRMAGPIYFGFTLTFIPFAFVDTRLTITDPIVLASLHEVRAFSCSVTRGSLRYYCELVLPFP